MLLDIVLQSRWLTEEVWAQCFGDQFQRIHPVLEPAVDVGGHIGSHRKLLFAQVVFHILAQHPAAVERQRPDADQKNENGKDRHSRFQ